MPEPEDGRVSWIDANGHAVRLLSSSTATTTRFVRNFEWMHAAAPASHIEREAVEAPQDFDDVERP